MKPLVKRFVYVPTPLDSTLVRQEKV